MFTLSALLAAALALPGALGDSGYVLPASGEASTSQFQIATEFGSGTACGVTSMPAGHSTGASGGQGSGQLYAAINQLAFGANPSAGAGGAGGACGLCYKITPLDASGQALTANALTFMIVDECPASQALSGSQLCGQCTVGEVNQPYGQHWHFDIASDAMNQAQYSQFFKGVTDGSNWKAVNFEMASCNVTSNQRPRLGQNGGCVSGSCKNNDKATVCQNVTDDKDHGSSTMGSSATATGGSTAKSTATRATATTPAHATSPAGGAGTGGGSGRGSGSGSRSAPATTPAGGAGSGSGSGSGSGGRGGSGSGRATPTHPASAGGGGGSGHGGGSASGGSGAGKTRTSKSQPQPTPRDARMQSDMDKIILRRHQERDLNLGQRHR